MLATLLFILCCAGPLAFHLWRKHQRETPSLQWPRLAPVLQMSYEAAPPRLAGERHGKRITIDPVKGGYRVAAKLDRPTKLRLEIGDKAAVAQRAGMVVPDPVKLADPAWNERLLARCSDPLAGEMILDPVLRQRLLAQPLVEILGKGQLVQATIQEAHDPDALEEVLDIVSVIAVELERFPETTHA